MPAVPFYLLAAVALISALSVIVRRSPIKSALALVICFFALSGIYVLLLAHFVAALQVLVYAGAIMVLFVFVVMLLNLRDDELGDARGVIGKTAGVIAIGVFGFAILRRVIPTIAASDLPNPPPNFGTVEDVGARLFTKFLLPFEITSLLLLVAIVGAMVIAKRRVDARASFQMQQAANDGAAPLATAPSKIAAGAEHH